LDVYFDNFEVYPLTCGGALISGDQVFAEDLSGASGVSPMDKRLGGSK
jgi:hypothetical protein